MTKRDSFGQRVSGKLIEACSGGEKEAGQGGALCRNAVQTGMDPRC